MKAGLQQLEAVIQPVSEAQVRALGALDWLEQERLPHSIRQYFIEAVETVLERVVPASEWSTLRGCGNAKKYRAAYTMAVQRGEFQR